MGPGLPTNIMSDPYANSVPHLEPNGSNWAIFSMRFQEAMEANLKWSHFDGSATRPVSKDAKNPTDDEKKSGLAWDQDEVMAHYLLSQHLCHGRIGALIFILSYLRTRDPERILLYVDRGMFIF